MAPSDQSNPQAGAGRPLPKKEHDMFRNMQKQYDMKQYKKAIKQADAILKKFPKHGETLAMKGLTCSSMGRNEEAHALVKEGLMNDMMSSMCWHVFGLLHRNERNFNEAIKAYKRALFIDKDNLNILRDLSMLQIQMRDLIGFEETRTTILQLRPSVKINWMALALAKHLTGDLRGATEVIDTYLRTLKEGSEELGRCVESSELALYKNRILAELPNNYQEALDHLGMCEDVVVDRGAWLQYKAEYHLKLKDFSAAIESVNLMFERGMTENYRVHSMFMCAVLKVDNDVCDQVLSLRGTQTLASWILLSPPQKLELRNAYEAELQPKYPNSYAMKQIVISLLDGDDFRAAADQLCRKHLSRGVPSLCQELQSFLWTEKDSRLCRPKDPVDIRAHPFFKIYTSLVDGYIDSLGSCAKFAPEAVESEPSSTIAWAWYLRAGLHELVDELVEASSLLDKCIEQLSSTVDFYVLKARVLSRSGDLEGAVRCIEKGRELDRQDRYMNNETTKYMLQAGMEEEALKTISLFAKHEGNPEQNLFDMQCSWYELEVAECRRKKQDYGRSLKKYACVLKHFDEIHDDQFDFHGYCLKKVTFRSYVDMLRFEDNVRGQDNYVKAALGTIQIYLHLFDNPMRLETEEPDYANMTAAERKKAKAIARKKKKAAEKEETDMQEAKDDGPHGQTAAKSGRPSFIESDPLGKELLAKDPLDEAGKLSSILALSAPQNIDTWITRYDVSIRRQKGLMALQALLKAKSIDPTNGDLFTRIVDFFGKIDKLKGLSLQAQSILKETAPSLVNHMDVPGFIREAAQVTAADQLTALPLRTAIAKAMVETKAGSIAEACALITQGGLGSRGVTVSTCQDALTVLQSFGSEGLAATEEWIKAVKARFPLLLNFG